MQPAAVFHRDDAASLAGIWRIAPSSPALSVRRLLKQQAQAPRILITDKLPSYRTAHREEMPGTVHDTKQYANNRAVPRPGRTSVAAGSLPVCGEFPLYRIGKGADSCLARHRRVIRGVSICPIGCGADIMVLFVHYPFTDASAAEVSVEPE